MSKATNVFRALEKHHNNPNTKAGFEKNFEKGKKYSLSDHVKGMILAMLSLQRPWGPIEEHLADLEKIFFYYDAEKLKSADSKELANAVMAIKCGNRRINPQMAELKQDIEYLEKIQKEHGSIDAYYRSMSKYQLVNTLDANLKQMGPALIPEYLSRVGVDLPKPDDHLMRIFGCRRLGFSQKENASNQECFDIISEIAKETREREKYIDYIFWCYCAEDRDNICDANPKCDGCVIKKYCNMGK